MGLGLEPSSLIEGYAWAFVDGDCRVYITGCLPLLIQLLHGSGLGAGGLFGSMRGCAAARVRATQALRNIVTSNPDSRRSRREERVLQLLEQIRAYCDTVATVAADSDTDDTDQHDRDLPSLRQGSLWSGVRIGKSLSIDSLLNSVFVRVSLLFNCLRFYNVAPRARYFSKSVSNNECQKCSLVTGGRIMYVESGLPSFRTVTCKTVTVRRLLTAGILITTFV